MRPVGHLSKRFDLDSQPHGTLDYCDSLSYDSLMGAWRNW